MHRLFFCLGSISAFIGVAAGAFAAHFLKERLDPAMLDTFEVAVRYQMYHALGLLATAWIVSDRPTWTGLAAGWLFAAGTVIFCGSLYALALSGILWLGAITPFGGLAFLAGWICLAWLASRGGKAN